MGDGETVRVRVWKGRNPDGDDYAGDPDEVVKAEDGKPHLWQDDPHYHSPPLGIDVHPDDCPARLLVYTSDSVQPAGPRFSEGYVDEGYWNGPVERGLAFPEEYGPEHRYRPFGCEVWGRVLFLVERGDQQ